MVKKFQFKGKDVDDAVTKACGRFGVDRDELDIAILSTGSTGIFGLLKKQASIEVCLLADVDAIADPEVEAATEITEDPQRKESAAVKKPEKKKKPAKKTAKKVEKKVEVEEVESQPALSEASPTESKTKEKGDKKARPRYRPPQHDPVPVPEEFHPVLEEELLKLLALMGMSGVISFAEENGKTKLDVQAEELIEPLTARDGQALDGLQYLLRKITSQALPENGMFVVDIDGFRARRRLELQELAITLSDEVKEKNVTRTIPPLNPSERRIVHMHLQDDTSIRSRSVGSGLFKKILIYKPGSRKRPNRKRSNRSRGGKGGRQDRNGNK